MGDIFVACKNEKKIQKTDKKGWACLFFLIVTYFPPPATVVGIRTPLKKKKKKKNFERWTLKIHPKSSSIIYTVHLDLQRLGALCGVTVNQLDLQTISSDLDSDWAPHSSGLVSHVS